MKHDSWKWCAKEVTSYLDCPVADHVNQTALGMVVAMFNPSTVPVNHTKFAVPHGKYSAEAYNKTTKKF